MFDLALSMLYIPWFKLEPWEIPGIPVKLQPFGLLVAIGILVGSRVAEWRGERVGVPRYLVADFLLYTIMIGGASAMLLNMALYEPEKLIGWFHGEASYPGLSSFGGFFGGTLAALWFRHRKRASIMVLGDIFCFAFPFAWLFGRTGCFVVHDHPGVVTDFFLAVDNYNLRGQPRHDLGLYEVLWSAAMIGVVLFLGRKPRPHGFFMALVPLAYAPVRFGLDYLRESPVYGGDVRYGGFTPGQYWAVLMLIVALVVARRVAKGPEVQLWLPGAQPETSASSSDGEKKGAGKSQGGKRQKKAKAR